MFGSLDGFEHVEGEHERDREALVLVREGDHHEAVPGPDVQVVFLHGELQKIIPISTFFNQRTVGKDSQKTGQFFKKKNIHFQWPIIISSLKKLKSEPQPWDLELERYS